MSRKVRITADAVLAIIRGIFEDEDVNAVIDDPSAPEEWQGKTINEVLNVEYFTFKHRPVSSQQIINDELMRRGYANWIAALDRSFCVCSLGNVERLYSKDVDMLALSATLEYFMQASKVKLLEFLVEDSNIATSGLRFEIKFGEEIRKAVIFFGMPVVNDLQSSSPYGEAAAVNVETVIMLYPDVISYADYEVSIGFTDENGVAQNSKIPLSSFSYVNTMTQDAAPYINNPRKVGSINLSCANSFVLVFEGYNIPFINYITDKAYSVTAQNNKGNNEPFELTVRRAGKSYEHTVVIKDHQIITNADTGNETHTLSLVTRGAINGTA